VATFWYTRSHTANFHSATTTTWRTTFCSTWMQQLQKHDPFRRVLNKGRNDLDWISVVDGGHLRKYTCVGVTFGKIEVRTPGSQPRDVNFVESRFTGRADLTAVRYSAACNGLSKTIRFRFQGNAFEMGHIWKIMCNVFLQIFSFYKFGWLEFELTIKPEVWLAASTKIELDREVSIPDITEIYEAVSGLNTRKDRQQVPRLPQFCHPWAKNA
jgi:hypothetical protein